VLVADHLDFDVARLGDEFLDEDAVVAEGGFGLGLSSARKPSRASASFQAMRMPLPPPPAEALIITG
jgi:hypothetical protein